MNKEINRISWLVSALIEQYRFVFSEIKNMQKINLFRSSVIFNSYIKHFNMSLNLLKQTEKIWETLIKDNKITCNHIDNLYSLYFKRCIYQFNVSYDLLYKMGYEHQLGQNLPYLSIMEKMSKLQKCIKQLNNSLINLHNFSL